MGLLVGCTKDDGPDKPAADARAGVNEAPAAAKRPAGNPEVEGYVVHINGGRFLVTAYEPARGRLSCNNATYFSGVPQGLQVGQKVRVWTQAVMESYPAQADADHVEIVTATPIAGAIGTEAEAIRTALPMRKTSSPHSVPFIVRAQYDTTTKSWAVLFAGNNDNGAGTADAQPLVVSLSAD